LLVLLINRRGLLLVGTSLASSSIIPAITLGRKTLPVRLGPTHIICLIIIICMVTEGLRGHSRLFIFGNLHLYPNLEALKVGKQHDRVRKPSWIRSMKQHVNGTRAHQGRLLH
jgi:hypothetical protein